MEPRLVMLGAAPETRGSIATVVEAYRAHGLFARWPIDYLPTHGAGGVTHNARLVLKAAVSLAGFFFRPGRIAMHLHTQANTLLRDGAFAASAFAARCPVILHLHGSGFEALYDRTSTPARTALAHLFERAACVAAPSESLCAWLRAVTRKTAYVVHLPNPVASDVQPQAVRPNLVLFLGRLESAKGIYDLLKAVAALRPEMPDLRLVCAGDGDRLSVAHYAERLGIAEVVKFTGWVGPSGKRALLESAAVFALPSYDASLPMSLVEAMAAGVPVVASKVGGIPEVVVDGVSGLLVAPGDTATLTRQLRKVILDRAYGAKLGAAARESARLRFSPERALPMLEALYAHALQPVQARQAI